MAGQLTPAELASANAAGMTPSEYLAAYSTPTATPTATPRGQPTGSEIADTNSQINLLDPARSIVDKAIGTPAQAAYDLGGKDYKPPPPKTGATAPTPESTWEQLANDQAEQYLKDTQAIAPYASGTAIPSTDQAMASSAAALIGASSSSPISQWLNQQSQAAQAQYGPTEAAGANVEKAEQAGENLIAGGMKQMGQAETALMAAAPYQQLLSSLAAEVPYHLAEGYPFPGLTGQNVQGGIQSAEQYLDISTAGQGTGGATPTLPAPTAAAGGTPSTSPVSSGNPSIPGG